MSFPLSGLYKYLSLCGCKQYGFVDITDNHVLPLMLYHVRVETFLDHCDLQSTHVVLGSTAP
eukprot:m.1077441 g.1077441  ORF g.1077441 m.1077441 type:complete len:62 (+) comp24251_c0_seq37:838-1023(+)